MIRTNAAYLFHQVTEAGSRAFSGDRALARRKALDAAEVAVASRKGGRKEHEAQRSVPSPATLPVGETRGFGGKAPDSSSSAESYAANRGWFGDTIVTGIWQSQWNGKVNTVCTCCVGAAFHAAVCLEEGHNFDASAGLSICAVARCNRDIKGYRHYYVATICFFSVFAKYQPRRISSCVARQWRISRCTCLFTLLRELCESVNNLCECVFHKIFQCKHLGAFAVGLQVSRWILVQSVSVANDRAQRNVRGAVFVSRPPLVTGGKI